MKDSARFSLSYWGTPWVDGANKESQIDLESLPVLWMGPEVLSCLMRLILPGLKFCCFSSPSLPRLKIRILFKEGMGRRCMDEQGDFNQTYDALVWFCFFL